MALRYQRQSLYSNERGVMTYEGVDPLTGLPVLIYEFEGVIPRGLENLESENIPGLLDTASEGGKAQAVIAYSRKYQPLAQPLAVTSQTLLLDSARALRDAASAGILHGDIKPERFWGAADHVMLEGFGIPWQDETSPFYADGEDLQPASDVYAWARSILSLTDGELGSTLEPILDSCLRRDANLRPEAADLYATLEAAVTQEAGRTLDDIRIDVPDTSLPTSPAVPGIPEPEKSKLEFEINVDESIQEQQKPVPESPRFEGGLYGQGAPPSTVTAEPKVDRSPAITGSGSRDTHPGVITSDPTKSFIKNPPPGATYHTGKAGRAEKPKQQALQEDVIITEERPRDSRGNRRTLLLFIVALASLLLAGLAFFRQGLNTYVAPAEQTVNYLVELDISPQNLPPVQVFVINSPEESRYSAGSILGSYPPGTRQIVLDKEGVWQLQARFQDRVSEIISFRLPEQRSVTLAIPEAEVEEEDPENP